jgi:probable rRNA maturation factor
MIFGEILISDDYVVSQAKAKDKELAEEIAFLLTHGFLHICGHTHENDTDEAKMNAATDKILKKIGIDYYKDII